MPRIHSNSIQSRLKQIYQSSLIQAQIDPNRIFITNESDLWLIVIDASDWSAMNWFKYD